MESFWNDLYYEDIHFRDNLQFELQSDFSPLPSLKENVSIQEFYFFIPSALQINKYTYTKEQFYKDRTNLIRYKTPEFSFAQLVDKDNAQSPLSRIAALKGAEQIEYNVGFIQDELKLLGNIVRSALRVSVRSVLLHVEMPIRPFARERLETATRELCAEITTFRNAYGELQTSFLNSWSGDVLQSFAYVDEYISNCIDYYLTGFLAYLRTSSLENIHAIDAMLCECITQESRLRQKYCQRQEGQSPEKEEPLQGSERILYHRGLLNKYVLDALLLGFERTSWVQKYGHIFASIAAGVAMLIYCVLLFLNVPNLGINSLPVLFLTVVFYVLKDRVKDSLKTLFHEKAGQWFSDYTTQIKGVNSETSIGTLQEFFSFVTENDLSEEIERIRNKEFSSDLTLFKQPEELFYYKKEMILRSDESLIRARRHKLHNIFLFNIHLLLEKASNPTESSLHLDPDTMEIAVRELPKVYYINIIMKNSYTLPDLQKKVEVKKFRMVINKNGIKRIETVH